MENIFKERLEKLMRENSISQMALSEEIGVTQSTLSRNINGIHRPKAEIIDKLASYFHVSVDYLLGNTDKRTPSPTPSSPKDQLQGIKLALYDQVEDLTDDQAQQVLDIIKIIKKDQK